MHRILYNAVYAALLKSDLGGIEIWCKEACSKRIILLKSDLGGIEIRNCTALRPFQAWLKSDLGGIETHYALADATKLYG